jgi:dUTP pyrophosphatase
MSVWRVNNKINRLVQLFLLDGLHKSGGIMEVKIIDKKLIEEYGLPRCETDLSAARDFRSTVNFSIMPNRCITIGLGVAYNILDRNVVLKLYPRSGMGSRGLILGNLTGLIDSDYQGEVKACLWNRTSEVISYARGERIVQGAFETVLHPKVKTVSEFSTITDRGSNGFGSTGSK